MKRLLNFILLAAIWMVSPISIQAQKIKVACMGNSITAGAGISNEADKYPSQLQTLLGDGYEVKNFGQNSQTVQMRGYDLTEGSKPGDCAYRNKVSYRQALAYKPDIVVLKLGTNDSKEINWLEDSPNVFRNDLNEMLDEIKANSNPKIYLCYPLRVKSSSWTINERNIHTIIGILKDVAQERGIDIINLHTAFEEELGDKWNTVYADGVHPNTQGAAIIADRVSKAILYNIFPDKDIYMHPTVGCIGGLRTFGIGVNDRTTESYPARLAEKLGARYTVANYGVGNRTFLRSGTENDPSATYDSRPCCYLDNNTFNTILSDCPDIVTIHLGEMDSKPWNWLHKSDFERDITEMTELLKKANADVKIYMCIPPRLYNNGTEGAYGKTYAEEVVPAIRNVASTLSLPLIDMTDILSDNKEYYKTTYQLNAAGHEMIASEIYNHIAYDMGDPAGIDMTTCTYKAKPIILYPNPVKSGSTLYIAIDTPLKTQPTLDVYQLSGALMRRIKLTTAHTASLYSVPIDIAPGIYLWRLYAGENIDSGRFTVK